jgi:hypothetical protein
MDSQTTQTLIAVLIVAAAALFMGAKVVRAIKAARAKRKGEGCGGDCCS